MRDCSCGSGLSRRDMTDLDIHRLAALAEAATPGPWWISTSDDTMISAKDAEIAQTQGEYSQCWKGMEADAAYIAAADPTTIMALIRRLQAAEAERDSRTPSVVVLALHDEIDQTRATLSAAEAELAATRAAIAEWRKEHWAAAADTTLMETLDRIAQGILA